MSTKVELIPIIPDKVFLDVGKLRGEMNGALHHVSNIIRDDFNKTVQTWTRKPTFTKKGPIKSGGNSHIDVFTENQIYTFVVRGTRAHVIRPRNAPMLRFRSGYTAKTRVRVIGSRAGGARGPFVSARSVVHPGTDARDFDKEIARRRQRNFKNLTRLAILRSFRFGGIR